MMKKLSKLMLVALLALSTQFAVAANVDTWIKPSTTDINGFVVTPELKKSMKNNIDVFLSLTPKKYKEMTGHKLNMVQVLKLKAAQKYVKKHYKAGEPAVSKGVFILLAFLGWAWLIMGLADDWKGSTWVTNLILYVLCYLPGLIHSFIKMKDYYQ
jgi:hypothetical protein